LLHLVGCLHRSLKHFSVYEELSKIEPKSYVGLHVKYLSFLLDFKLTCNFLESFSKKKYSIIIFHAKLSSGNRVVLCEQKDGQTDRYDEANSHFSKFCELYYKVEV